MENATHEFDLVQKLITNTDWNLQEIIDIFLTMTKHNTWKAWKESLNDGVQIEDSKFIGLRLPKSLRNLYEKTDEEIGLGYADLQEFVKEAVRMRFEEIWRVFREEKVQLDIFNGQGEKE